MKRNIAFVLSTKIEPPVIQHLKKIAQQFNFKIAQLTIFKLKLAVIYEESMKSNSFKEKFEFSIGKLDRCENKDRFVDITVTKHLITLKNDCVGSIPVYYSKKNKQITISNIEPCVILNSDYKDIIISKQRLFEFVKFNHLIWDKTIFTNINIIKPDCRFTYNLLSKKTSEIKSNNILISNTRINYTDKEVASDLYQLNSKLVTQALKNYEEIILPLSSGYDSRMIFAVIAENENLRKKTKCFTYGNYFNVESQAAKKLCSEHKVFWKHIELKCNFLQPKYLFPILQIFGSSLPVHGMYQLEFFDQIKDYFDTKNPVLTSGFMTGASTGQYLNLLDTKTSSLYLLMNSYCQSKYWQNKEFKIEKAKFINKAEGEFTKVINRFGKNSTYKKVILNLWTRQRNFISYYPKTLEYVLPVISPHMTSEFQNFFFSLSAKHLIDRKAVKLMFKNYYPSIAAVYSNGSGSIAPILVKNILWEKLIIKLRKSKLKFLLPDYYKDNDFGDLDTKAILNQGRKGLFPLNQSTVYKEIISYFYDNTDLLDKAALGGNDYQKATSLQAAAYGILLKNSLK